MLVKQCHNYILKNITTIQSLHDDSKLHERDVNMLVIHDFLSIYTGFDCNRFKACYSLGIYPS